jgi:hypothetical protein
MTDVESTNSSRHARAQPPNHPPRPRLRNRGAEFRHLGGGGGAKSLAIGALAAALSCPSAWSADIHVRAVGGSDSNDGSTWALAVQTLEQAFALASGGDTIRVAAGEYLPFQLVDLLDPRSAVVWLGAGGDAGNLVIKGGYPAAGGPDTGRDPAGNPSIITGDLDGNDGSSVFTDNAYHVVFFSDATSDSRLDGMQVTAGRADVAGIPTPLDGHGAGILMTHSDAEEPCEGVVQNCIVFGNVAQRGGGLAIRSFFSGEPEELRRPSIRTTVFHDNDSAKEGGGILVDGMSVEMLGCEIRDNHAAGFGGGAMVYSPRAPASVLVNCTIVRNTNGQTEGAGLSLDAGDEPIQIDSSIIVMNVSGSTEGFEQQLFPFSFPEDVVSLDYSNVTGYATSGFTLGVGNLSFADPTFVNPTLDDFRLALGSPCLDVGNPDSEGLPRDTYDADEDLVTDDEALPDVKRRARVQDALGDAVLRVDMGAHERTCRLDLNGDGIVGAADVAILLGAWGSAPGHIADLDGDDEVGPADLAILLGGFGACEEGGQTQKESLLGGEGESSSALGAPDSELAAMLGWFGFDDGDAFAAWVDEAGPETAAAMLAVYLAMGEGS